jgi:hypothetical protein
LSDSERRTPRHRWTAYADALQAATAAAAALASVGYFRPWVVLSANLGSASFFELSGYGLAGEADVWIPWAYVTPIALLLVLGAASVRLLVRGRPVRGSPVRGSLVRIAYGMAITILAIPILIWPVTTLARVTHNLTHLQIGGAVTLKLWWWIYCFAIGVIIVAGIADLIRERPGTRG